MSAHPRLLIVDDRAEIHSCIRSTFSKDYTVVTANNPRQALNILSQEPQFAAIISDMDMTSKMTGNDLFLEVERSYPELAQRFIFFVGEPDDVTVQGPPVYQKGDPLSGLSSLVRSLPQTQGALKLREACQVVEEYARRIGPNCAVTFMTGEAGINEGVEVAPFSWGGSVVEPDLFRALVTAMAERE